MNSNNPAAEFEAVPTLKKRICSVSANEPLSFPAMPTAFTLVWPYATGEYGKLFRLATKAYEVFTVVAD